MLQILTKVSKIFIEKNILKWLILKKNKVEGFHYLINVDQCNRTENPKKHTHIHTHIVRINKFFNKYSKTVERKDSF